MAISPRMAIIRDSAFGNEQDYLMSSSTTLRGSSIFEDMRYVTRLVELSHVLNGDAQKSVDHLCREVENMTQKRVKIIIRQDCEKGYAYADTTAILLPLQFKHHTYGTLAIAYDNKEVSDEPAIPLPIAHVMAQMCSWLLYTIEQSAFVQKQYQQLEYQINGPLTRREKEVLALMFQGCNQQTIADTLCISPATVRKHRQHIYSQLGVHCERDAVLAAYFAGMFSLIEKCP